MRRASLLVALAPLAAALALVPGEAAAPAAGAARVHTIVMSAMKFGAVPAGIRAGDVIVWVNRDVVPHSATARDRSFDIDLRQGQAKRMVVRNAGRFAFYCRYHPGMTGTLAVRGR